MESLELFVVTVFLRSRTENSTCRLAVVKAIQGEGSVKSDRCWLGVWADLMIIVVPHGLSNKHALNAKVNDIVIIAKTLYFGGCWTKTYPVVNNAA